MRLQPLVWFHCAVFALNVWQFSSEPCGVWTYISSLVDGHVIVSNYILQSTESCPLRNEFGGIDTSRWRRRSGIPDSSLTCSSVRLWDVDSTRCRKKRLEAFHMKCQRQITKIRWQDHVRNSEVSALAGFDPELDLIKRRRNSVFGHIARLSEDTPAHQALRCHIDLSLGHLPEQGWRRRPGRPSNRWIDQLRGDNNTPLADQWRRSIRRGHSEVTLRSSPTIR